MIQIHILPVTLRYILLISAVLLVEGKLSWDSMSYLRSGDLGLRCQGTCSSVDSCSSANASFGLLGKSVLQPGHSGKGKARPHKAPPLLRRDP